MKIRVKQVTRNGPILRVELAHEITSPEGQRALRILKMHTSGGYSVDSGTVTFTNTATGTQIDTLAKCESVLKEWDNIDLKLHFHDVNVGILGSNRQVTDLTQLRKLQTQGATIWFTLRISANFPIIDSDLEAVSKIVPGEVGYMREDNHSLLIRIKLQGPRDTLNPWRYAQELPPAIRRVIK